jgi:type IV pilus assembly protein PilA
MKKMNNKGFSLVELIIVIAIMAILIAVLAPQYLRYVEKSRLQADNSAVGEVANAVKVAAANDLIASELSDGQAYTFTTTPGTPTFTGSSTPARLNSELSNVVGNNVQMKSNSYKTTCPTLTIKIDSATKTIQVSGSNYIKEVGETATGLLF